MASSTRKTSGLFQAKTKVPQTFPQVIVMIGICLLAGLFMLITQRMNELRQAPGDNLTWSLSQVEVDVLILMDEALLARRNDQSTMSEVRRRFDSFYSRTSTLRDAPVFAPMRNDETFSAQLLKIEQGLEKLTSVVDQPDKALFNDLDKMVQELARIREDAHAIALTGIGLHSQASDAERASLAGLLLTAAVVSMATILFLMFVLFGIMRQHRMHRDVTKSVQRANARLKSSFDVSLDAIIVANDQGVILEFNEAAETVFGFTADEAIGSDMSQLIIPHHLREAHLAGMARYNRTKEPHLVGQGRIEITALRKTGEEFPVEISIGAASDHRGAIFISYLRDITERLAAEEALKSARDEALAAEDAKSNFLAVMSHEMRTPLNGIFGTLELLSNSKVTKKQRGYLEIAKRSGDILMHHVNDVLDISRMEAEKMELVASSFDLKQFFQEVITTNEATADAQSNTLVLELEKMPKRHVLMDERRLRQITYNLLSNALKFTKAGTVTLAATTRVDDRGVEVLEFTVSDTGVGINTEDQPHVFDRFYTQDCSYDRFASGAGLGLAICKQLVEMMGGIISLESTQGKGSSFTVSLPFEADVAQSNVAATVVEEYDTSSLRGKEILLVEDNEINRLIVHEMLATQGILVHEAHNGQQAVDMSKNRAFDVILMDVSMPILNGIDATKCIRQSSGPNQHRPILGLTAHALEQEQTRFVAAGMTECLSKPIAQTTLIQALLRAVQAESDRPQAAPPKQGQSLISEATFGELAGVFPPERLKKLVTGFEAEISELLKAIPVMLENGDLQALAASAHKSVGSSGMIGALDLQKQLRALEQAAKASDAGLAQTYANAVTEVWPATQTALRDRTP